VGTRWWSTLALVACGLAGFPAGTRARAAEPKGEAIEAEMLKDLDFLREANMVQQGELYRRMRVLERLRMLESLGYLEGSPSAEPESKEKK